MQSNSTPINIAQLAHALAGMELEDLRQFHDSVQSSEADIEDSDRQWFSDHPHAKAMCRKPNDLEKGLAAISEQECHRIEILRAPHGFIKISFTDGPYHHGEPEELVLPSSQKPQTKRPKPRGFGKC